MSLDAGSSRGDTNPHCFIHCANASIDGGLLTQTSTHPATLHAILLATTKSGTVFHVVSTVQQIDFVDSSNAKTRFFHLWVRYDIGQCSQHDYLLNDLPHNCRHLSLKASQMPVIFGGRETKEANLNHTPDTN
jgi:hypothetical protein